MEGQVINQVKDVAVPKKLKVKVAAPQNKINVMINLIIINVVKVY